jgi:hypothetical protein
MSSIHQRSRLPPLSLSRLAPDGLDVDIFKSRLGLVGPQPAKPREIGVVHGIEHRHIVVEQRATVASKFNPQVIQFIRLQGGCQARPIK